MRDDDRYRDTRYYYGPYRVEYQQDYQSPSSRGGLRISNEEKKHLLMAVGALTLAFTLLLRDSGFHIATIIILAFIAVCTAFLFHEFGHKIVAQRYGCWAEFRAMPFGLFLAVISGLIGFLIAAPGAVYIKGRLTKEENGKVSAAGPIMNITVVSFLMPFLFLLPDLIAEIWTLIWMICFLNVWIGGFNMIPFPPLDGSKIWRWNKGVYIFMGIILGIYLFILWP